MNELLSLTDPLTDQQFWALVIILFLSIPAGFFIALDLFGEVSKVINNFIDNHRLRSDQKIHLQTGLNQGRVDWRKRP